MPKKSSVDPATILDKLQNYRDVILQNVNKSSASIWDEISQSLNRLISAKAIYTFVRKNYHNCWECLGVMESNFTKTIHFEHEESDSEIQGEGQDYIFNIEFNEAKWNLIRPIEIKYRDLKTRYKFKKGWTDAFNDLFISSTQSKCVWIFKDHFVTKIDNYFKCQINGFCKECSAIITAQNEDNNERHFITNVTNVKTNKHMGVKKRRLAGIKRENLGNDLMHGKLAINWRREEASKIDYYDDIEPNNLYSLNVLRKCRQEAVGKKINYIPKDSCPIKALEILKYSQPFIPTIRNLGADKFHLHYWTQEQLHIYNNYCSNETPRLAIDATGTLVNKLTRPYGYKSGHIFLYAGVIHLGIKSGQIPVVQMLSEAHDTNSISFWIRSWLQSGAHIPKIVICDHSAALLNAIVMSFANMNLNKYIECSFNILLNKTNDLPNIYLRTDYAHTIKLMRDWNCFKTRNNERLFKEFYLHSMAILIKVNDIQTASNIIESLFIVANSVYSGISNGMNNPCEVHKNKLKLLISGCDVIELDKNLEEEDIKNESISQFLDVDNINISKWVGNIKQIALNQCVIGDNENYYYSPDFSKDLERFLKTFVLWSGVMKTYYGFGKATESSAIVESYFNDLKNRTFKELQLPMRVDKFFKIHFDSIQNSLKLATAEKNAQKQQNILKSETIDKVKIDTDKEIRNIPLQPSYEDQNENIEILNTDVDEDTVISGKY